MLYLGQAYQKRGLAEEAEKIFKKLVKLKDNNDDEINPLRENYFDPTTYAMFQMARIFITTNRMAEAEQMLKKLLQNQLTFGPAYRSLGTVYGAEGDTVLANKYADRANDLADYAANADKYIDDIALLSRSDEY